MARMFRYVEGQNIISEGMYAGKDEEVSIG